MKGYRTFLVSLMIAVFGILNMTNWDAFFADPKAGAIALASAIIMAIMRLFTNTPPGQSEPAPPPPPSTPPAA